MSASMTIKLKQKERRRKLPLCKKSSGKIQKYCIFKDIAVLQYGHYSKCKKSILSEMQIKTMLILCK